MIKINYEDKKNILENVYWNWFSKYHLNDFRELVKNDKEFKALILNNIPGRVNYRKGCVVTDMDWDERIKKYLLSLPDKHYFYVKAMSGKNIKKKTKVFLLNQYKNFRNTQAIKIVNALGIFSCPYCNRNFIDIYYGANSIVANRFNGDIDHYFPKDPYPYLAISLYNLIPSCKSCNHEKNNEDKRVFHPYMDSHIGLYEIKTNFNGFSDYTIDYIYGLSEDFKIKIEVIPNSSLVRMNNSKQVFHLEDKYGSMQSHAKDIIRKAYIYNSSYIKDLANDYRIINENELKRIIFSHSLSDDNHLDKPLSKFTYDILKEFDII